MLMLINVLLCCNMSMRAAPPTSVTYLQLVKTKMRNVLLVCLKAVARARTPASPTFVHCPKSNRSKAVQARQEANATTPASPTPVNSKINFFNAVGRYCSEDNSLAKMPTPLSDTLVQFRNPKNDNVAFPFNRRQSCATALSSTQFFPYRLYSCLVDKALADSR